MMGRHFSHKVEVGSDGASRTIRLPAGELALVPAEGILHVQATAPDVVALAHVQEVGVDHLRRFARGELDFTWSTSDA